MHNFLYIFQASLKLAGEMLITLIAAFICLVVREIYQAHKNERKLI
jgi:hypothetical protein